MKKNFNINIIFIVALFNTIIFSKVLTDEDKLSKFTKLGLDVANAIAEQKNVEEGLKEFAKGKFDDWMWDSIGGYEKLWTGQLDITDAYVIQAKGKVGKILDIVSKIKDFATKVSEGTYDEAAFIVLDSVVGEIDHPLVKLLWLSVKIAYESHKLVQETTAELEIERLYSIVNKDRRLSGVIDPNLDQPKLIPEDQKTAEYFFEKYLIVNDEIRELMKSYVTKVLKDKWPEQSWSDWLSGKISGEDTKRAAEIEKLGKELREKGISWIMELIKDLNKQVKTAWAEARVRQEMYKFEVFASQMEMFYKDLPSMLEEFKRREQYKKEIPQYKQYLSESPKVLEETKNLAKDIKKLEQVKKTIALWKSNLSRAYARAYLIGELSLYESLEREYYKWSNFLADLNRTISELEKKAIEEPQVVYVVETPTEEQYYKSYFAGVISPFDDWRPTIEEILDGSLEELNKGNFEEAKKIFNEWKDLQRNKTKEHYSKIKMKIKEILEIKLKEIEDEASKESNYTKRQEILSKKNFVSKASNIAYDIVYELEKTAEHKISNAENQFLTAYTAFENLKNSVGKRVLEYKDFVNYKIKSYLPTKTVIKKEEAFYPFTAHSDDTMIELFYSSVGSLIEELDSKDYSVKAKYDVDNVSELIRNIEYEIEYFKQGNIDLNKLHNYSYSLNYLNNAIKRWLSIPEIWKNQKQDLSEKEKKMILVFFKEDIDKEIAETDKIIEEVKKLIKDIREKEKLVSLKLEEDKRKREEVISWLSSKKSEVKKFIDSNIKSNILKEKGRDDYELVLERTPEGLIITNEPYKHYMFEREVAEYIKNISNSWNKDPGFLFIKSKSPKVYEKFVSLLNLGDIKFSKEPNCIAQYKNGEIILWQSNVDKFEKLVKETKYDLDEFKFNQAIMEISNIFPAVLTSDDKTYVRYAVSKDFEGYEKYFSNSSVGEKFLSTVEKLKKLLEKREEYLKKTTTAGIPTGPVTVPPITGPGTPGGPGTTPTGPGTGTPSGPVTVTPTGPEDGTRKKFPTPPIPIEPPTKIKNLKIQNAKVNNITPKSTFEELVLTNSDLINGQIIITAKLFNFDNSIEQMFISEDSFSWTEIPKRQDINYRFTPILNKNYYPELKVKIGNEEIQQKFFPNIRGLVYKNIDYKQEVIDMVKKISEAYESQNILLFENYVSINFLGNKNFLIEGVRNDFNYFHNIRLTIFIEGIEKSADTYVVSTKWDKSQMVYMTNKQQRTTGKTKMIFAFENGVLRLKNLKGNLIFATLSPEIAQTSGLPPTVVEKIREANEEKNPIQPGAEETIEDGGVKDNDYNLIVNIVGNGKVTKEPDYLSYPAGTQVTLTAVPDSGYQFSSWSGDATGTQNPITVIVNSNLNITANFFTLLPVKNGSVTSSPPPPPSNIHGYDFSSEQETTVDGGDFNFLLYMGAPIFDSVSPAGIQKISGVSFDDLDTAPPSGYGQYVTLTVGDVLVFKTREGFYGKAEITSITFGPPTDNVTFKYAIQLDGSTNLKTK